MESFYFSLVLILLGVIVGAIVVLGFIRGLSSPVWGRDYGGYPPGGYLPAPERGHSMEWLGALVFFVLVILLLNASKAKLDAWWGKTELSSSTPHKPDTITSTETIDSTSTTIAITSPHQDTLTSQVVAAAAAIADSFYVQIGAYTQRNSAEALQQYWLQEGQTARLCIDASTAISTVYKLWIGPFRNREEAQGFIRRYPQLKGFILSYPAKA